MRNITSQHQHNPYTFCSRAPLASPLSPPAAAHHNSPSPSCLLVRDLLRSSSDPHLRVITGQPGPLTPIQVRRLGAAVVQHLVQQSVEEGVTKGTVHYNKFREWAASIAACFKGEDRGLWFEVQPKIKGGTKCVYRPSGRLWERYNNLRRTFKTPEGRPIKKTRLSTEDDLASTSDDSSTSTSTSQPPRTRKKKHGENQQPTQSEAGNQSSLSEPKLERSGGLINCSCH